MATLTRRERATLEREAEQRAAMFRKLADLGMDDTSENRTLAAMLIRMDQ